ncbi:hypothetical protein LV83_03692 [Algoriphagus yeomjeoni]|uniref:Uncharacterized protein n=2 Tax=Algoriphagus yeomjeoni TaxID=291403 RepID=A0A327P3Z8_9BACT|nr:hypothetical protein LV83_03692 [Algoriphagus yeomjeoni]
MYTQRWPTIVIRRRWRSASKMETYRFGIWILVSSNDEYRMLNNEVGAGRIYNIKWIGDWKLGSREVGVPFVSPRTAARKIGVG